MAAQNSKAFIAAFSAALPPASPNPHTSKAADYLYRVAALAAGIALLMSVV